MTDKTYLVKNRSAGIVVYNIPGVVRREFKPGQTLSISEKELEKLTWQPGGKELMEGYLMIQSAEAVKDLNLHTEQEYWMNEQQVVDLLQKGSLDEFLDALDFAPAGVLDLIKKYAVELPLTDMNKANALEKKTGFSVAKALMHIKEEREATGAAGKPAAPKRRVNKTEETPQPARRTENKYKVVG